MITAHYPTSVTASAVDKSSPSFANPAVADSCLTPQQRRKRDFEMNSEHWRGGKRKIIKYFFFNPFGVKFFPISPLELILLHQIQCKS